MSDTLLPIKVVVARDNLDYISREVTARQWEPFRVVTDEIRGKLSKQALDAGRHFARTFPDWGTAPAVAKVTLIPEALAKTYQPKAVFNDKTCPIIGAGALGELYVSATPVGIRKLADRIMHGDGKVATAHISTIDRIEPYSLQLPPGLQPRALAAPKQKEKAKRLRCRLFQHPGQDTAASDQAFVQFAESKGASRVERMAYATGIRIYCLHDVPPDNIPDFQANQAIEDINVFPVYHRVRSMYATRGTLTADLFPPPVPGVEYGVVGLIDSGTDPNNEHLQAWVVDRWDWNIPRDMQDNTHGSFVAGVAIHGRLLNNGSDQFPSASCRIVDVVALDRDGTIDEYELIGVIDKAVEKYPFVRVWNLSLGRDTPCVDDIHSPLGVALDERMKKHDIVFVSAVGNYETRPLRDWPPDGSIAADADRLCPPADASRGVTVGGIAHLDNDNTCVRRGEPSPFSRRGPAPSFGIKPEVAYPAGNCDRDGRHTQTGIVSVDGDGNETESIGTSYATPLASSVMANLIAELSSEGELAPIPLAKALFCHSAFLRSGPPTADELRYRGIGCPLDVNEILQCRQSAATIILQVPLTPRPDFVKNPFPLPRSLFGESDSLQCEMFMTLYYDSPLDASCHFEYTRVNVEASLGEVRERNRKDKDPANLFGGELNLVPRQLKKLYPGEKDRVQHGFKWSPLKFYHRKFSRKEVQGPWELRLGMLTRNGVVLENPIDVFLVVTLRSAKPEATVYNELVTEMAQLGWGANNLKIRSQERH